VEITPAAKPQASNAVVVIQKMADSGLIRPVPIEKVADA
jgi:hypothetical protein